MQPLRHAGGGWPSRKSLQLRWTVVGPVRSRSDPAPVEKARRAERQIEHVALCAGPAALGRFHSESGRGLDAADSNEAAGLANRGGIAVGEGRGAQSRSEE